jgi:hypothetical protein
MREDWEPEPYELPLEAPRHAPRDQSHKTDDPLVDESDSDSPSRVIVIDLA